MITASIKMADASIIAVPPPRCNIAQSMYQDCCTIAKQLLTRVHALRIISSMVKDSAERLTSIFLALAHPTRRAILERLARGEASGTELARPFAISVPAISKHLRVLEHAELILHRKDGRTHLFRLAAHPMREAAAWLDHYRRFWEEQFDSLDAYLQVTAEKEQGADESSHPS
jgi:DNA-binding transcriptional ArsR family regulator